MDIQEVTLEQIEVALYLSVSKELMGVKAEARLDILTDQIVVGVRGFVLGRTQSEVQVKFPSDWKQAIKERFAPKWILAKWPVQYSVYSMKAADIYPTFKPALPDHRVVVITTLNQTYFSD